jgi:hypothetical protein
LKSCANWTPIRGFVRASRDADRQVNDGEPFCGTSLAAAFRRPNSALAWIPLAVMMILSLSLHWPAASALFRFGPLHAYDLALTFSAGIGVLIVLETLKHLWRPHLGL